MNRFKFRAWDKTEKEMFMISHLYYTPLKNVIILEKSHDNILQYPDEAIIMQSTGLKDTNSKEIYEGDICQYIDMLELTLPFEKGQLIVGIIEFNFNRIALMLREKETNHKGGRYWQLWDNCHKVEIIGNIYGNPELLESKVEAIRPLDKVITE